MKRKALITGIDNYPGNELHFAVSDAVELAQVLETHADGDPNFSIRLHTDIGSRSRLLEQIQRSFAGDDDLALFYFAGHGANTEMGTFLITPDISFPEEGISLSDIQMIANQSRIRNRVIILDCCHAGAMGTSILTGGISSLINPGVTILASCRSEESSREANGHGIFTNLLLEALKGGAADIRGHITPGSIYAYIDRALGAWEQRPVFKTNITEFVSLRKALPSIPDQILRKLADYFPSAYFQYPLAPSYENTNSPATSYPIVEPYADPAHVSIFKDLQAFQACGLVAPVNAPHMFFAAMESKHCRLTPLGHHYWHLAKARKI